MKCKMSAMKVCAALILGIVAFGLSLSSLDSAVTNYEIERNTLSPLAPPSPPAPIELIFTSLNQTTAEPLVRLFQVLFILFIISPPLIVVMLLLIYKELKKRNEMK